MGDPTNSLSTFGTLIFNWPVPGGALTVPTDTVPFVSPAVTVIEVKAVHNGTKNGTPAFKLDVVVTKVVAPSGNDPTKVNVAVSSVWVDLMNITPLLADNAVAAVLVNGNRWLLDFPLDIAFTMVLFKSGGGVL